MATIVSRVSALLTEYVISDLRIVRRGYLNIFSFLLGGSRRPYECLYRGAAAIVMPVDWAKHVVYLVTQPRATKAFLWHAEARAALAVAKADGACGRTVTVPADAMHVVDCPAGMVDAGESDAAAAIRELREEAGFVIDESRLSLVSDHGTSVGANVERHVCYFADVTGLTPAPQAEGDGDERIETRAFSFDEAFALLAERRADSSSLAVMLRELKLQYLERLAWAAR